MAGHWRFLWGDRGGLRTWREKIVAENGTQLGGADASTLTSDVSGKFWESLPCEGCGCHLMVRLWRTSRIWWRRLSDVIGERCHKWAGWRGGSMTRAGTFGSTERDALSRSPCRIAPDRRRHHACSRSHIRAIEAECFHASPALAEAEQRSARSPCLAHVRLGVLCPFAL